MQRILIIGCSGAGKSTLSVALRRKLGLPIVHLDREYWRPGFTPPPREEFIVHLAGLLAREAWIMDGNYDSTLEQRLQRADAAVFLDFSGWRCLASTIGRILRQYGKVRADMSPGCPERWDWKFFWWIWNYRRDARPGVLATLAKAEAQGVEVIILHSRQKVKSWLDGASVLARVKNPG
jgi:adenylate kinase family enzyme